MATTGDDLEAFLNRLDRVFEKADDQTYLVSLGVGQPPAVLRLEPPVLLAQVDITDAPKNNPSLEARLYRRLLELNATDLVYVAFGIEGERIVLDAALEFSTMDINELEAVLSNLDLAVSDHVPELHELVKRG
jgi:hypothetical protein